MKEFDWMPFEEVSFSDNEIKCYHVDTRDFHCSGNDHIPLLEMKKVNKDCNNYFHTPEEIKTLLTRYKKESGGDIEWRMLTLTGTAKYRTGNWQFKYIRIFKFNEGLLVFDDDFVFPKDMLANKVEQKHLNAH